MFNVCSTFSFARLQNFVCEIDRMGRRQAVGASKVTVGMTRVDKEITWVPWVVDREWILQRVPVTYTNRYTNVILVVMVSVTISRVSFCDRKKLSVIHYFAQTKMNATLYKNFILLLSEFDFGATIRNCLEWGGKLFSLWRFARHGVEIDSIRILCLSVLDLGQCLMGFL